MLEPIVKTIEVPCNREQAFTIFVQKVSSWWPLDKASVSAMDGAVAKQVVIEPKVGGRVYEIGHDDQEQHWGSVTKYNPYSDISMNWHIGMPAENASDVTVVFIELDNGHTKVELTHSQWENYGDKAEESRNNYNGGWVAVFEQAFKDACSH